MNFFNEISLLNIISLLWLILAWSGYTLFAYFMGKNSRNNLSFELNALRKQWMRELLKRDLRIADATLISNLERNVTFLASSSKLILLGLITAMAATDSVQSILNNVPFVNPGSELLINIKIFVLIIIYTYAFFTLSWSMRQYGFVTVVFGAAPSVEEAQENQEIREEFIRSGSKLIDLAGHTYNNGLRAYYFSLSILAWFISPWLFMLATTAIVIMLYIREFQSLPLTQLRTLSQSTRELID